MPRLSLLNVIGAAVLLAGLGFSAWVYRAALVEEERLLAAQRDGGAFHHVLPSQSKRFLHDLEVYGGKANVMMYHFQAWLEGLFQGRSLAVVLALLSLATAGGCFFAARRRPDPETPETEGG